MMLLLRPASEAEQEKLVLGISKQTIKSYMKIVVGDETIYAGLEQKFYVPQEDKWVNACDINGPMSFNGR